MTLHRTGEARVLLVGGVHILNGEDGKDSVVAEVAEGKLSTLLDAEFVDLGLVDVQVDRHAHEAAIDQTVGRDDRVVVLLSHEACCTWWSVWIWWPVSDSSAPRSTYGGAVRERERERGQHGHTFQRRETTIEDQLEIAKVTLRQGEGGKLLGLSQELGLARQIAGKEVL